MKLEKGQLSDLAELECLYNDLNDYLDTHINYPGWIKGIYPVKETAAAGLESGCLFVTREAGRITGSAILNHKPETAYANVDWGTEIDYKEIFVVHTFVVHPDLMHQGLGKILLDLLIDYSRQRKMKAIRLDVYVKNMPAIHLYKKCGFQYMDTISLGYESYGLDQFELYQQLL